MSSRAITHIRIGALGMCTALLFFGAPLSAEAPPWSAPRPSRATPHAIPNAKIDAARYQSDVEEAMRLRAARRLTTEQFRTYAAEPGTVVLDARTPEKYEMLHIAGAKSLPYTDFTKAALSTTIPTKDTRVLIYCNNNFEALEEAFPTKSAPAALNLATFTSLYTYGYRNVYELGPVLDPTDKTLRLEGPHSDAAPARR